MLTLDIGFYYQGFHTDFAETVIIGSTKNQELITFLETGRQALKKAIAQAKVNNRLGDISEAIEQEITKKNYCIIKDLTGHGIGKELHEDPFILGFLDRPKKQTTLINSGLTIAIEVIYSQSSQEIAYEEDGGWSIITKDGSLSACFEHTVAITNQGTTILT